MGLTHGASAFTLEEADHAYRVGLLEVAEEAYSGLLGGDHDKTQVVLRLLEIALRRGAWDRAEELLRSPELQGDEGLLYWEAQVALGLNKTREAEFSLAQFLKASPEHALALPASLSLAAFQLDAGQFEVAKMLLEPWSRSDDIRVDYLKARLSLESGDIDDAINRFERLRQSPDGLPKDWLAKVYLGLAMERLAKRPVQRESAAELLREYLEEFSPSASDSDAVALLVQAEAFATSAQRDAWEIWATEKNPDLRALIAVAVSKAYAKSKAFTLAISALDVIKAGHLSYEESLVLHARWLLDAGNASACVAFVEETAGPALAESEWLPDLQMVLGAAQYASKDSEAALRSFTLVGETSEDAELSKVAAFNKVVLNSANEGQEAHESAMRDLYEVAEPAVQNLLGGRAAFFRARLLARVPGDRRAADAAFRDYLNAYPIHPHRSEALIARLELALVALSPDRSTVESRLKRVREGVAEGFIERVEYLTLWAAVVTHQHARAHELIGKFKEAFPASPWLRNVALREVELRLAEGSLDASLRKEVLAMARSEDLQVQEQASLILATMWGRSGNHEAAIKEWGRVIDITEGRIQLLARHGSALSHCRVNDRDGANGQWDEVLRLSEQPDLRVRALIGKGEGQALSAASDPKAGEEAILRFGEVLAMPGLAAEWKDQAGYRIGMVQLALGFSGEALETFRKIVSGYEDRLREAPRNGQPECNEWVYRAGFEAVGLMELGGEDRAAAARAEDLARFPGDRSDEAKARADAILLEHWIFSEP